MTHGELRVMVDGAQPLLGCHLQRVVQPDPFTVTLRWMRHWLLIGVAPGASRLHRLGSGPRAPEQPPAFAMLLRKVLMGAPLSALELRPDDRRVHLVTPAGTLVAELFGARPDLLLLGPGPAQPVLGSLRGVSPRAVVGAAYAPPEPPVGPREEPAPRFADGDEAEAWYGALALEERRRALLGRGHRLRRRLCRTAARVEGDLRRCQGAEEQRRRADLLLAHQQTLPRRGASEAEVADLFGDGAPLTIPLDPALDLVQNAQKLYRQSKRLGGGRETVARRLDELRRRLQALQGALSAVERADAQTFAGAAEALQALLPGGQVAPGQRRGARDEARSLPYRTFTAADGTPLYIGKNARGNHQLTFHHARGRDLWLHARDLPGSHGVVRRQRAEDISRQTLLDAATLVAHYSGAKEGDTVEISYTERKNVRPGARDRPGQVYVSDAKTLRVTVERARLARLMGR